MIVFDENIFDQDVIDDLNRWYKGKVVSIKDLRLRTLIKDEAVPTILRTVKQPTFLTTNVSDYVYFVLFTHLFSRLLFLGQFK